jgi:hypothetical protein
MTPASTIAIMAAIGRRFFRPTQSWFTAVFTLASGPEAKAKLPSTTNAIKTDQFLIKSLHPKD